MFLGDALQLPVFLSTPVFIAFALIVWTIINRKKVAWISHSSKFLQVRAGWMSALQTGSEKVGVSENRLTGGKSLHWTFAVHIRKVYSQTTFTLKEKSFVEESEDEKGSMISWLMKCMSENKITPFELSQQQMFRKSYLRNAILIDIESGSWAVYIHCLMWRTLKFRRGEAPRRYYRLNKIKTCYKLLIFDF